MQSISDAARLAGLARIDLFQTLPRETLERLAAAVTHLQPRNGAKLFVQGDSSGLVFAIVGGEGCVRIGSVSRRDKALMVEVFRQGDLFGEVGVIDDLPRTADAVVDGSVRLAAIPKSVFMEVLEDTPALGAAMARSLAQRLRRTFSLLEDATFETLEVRLARQLLYLLRNDSRRTDRGQQIGIRLNQRDMADLLGATNRSIITILNAWRNAGIVHFDAVGARLTVVDEAYLQKLIDPHT